MFGAVYGDIIGSCYEIHSTKDYDFPFYAESTFTDDTVMTAAVCRAILNNPSNIGIFGVRKRAYEYAAQYRQFYSWFPRAGFGSMFSSWARKHDAKFQNSYANGGAMRIIPIGWAYDSLKQVTLQAKASCLPSHGHKDAIRCATAVAVAVFFARKGESKEFIKDHLQKKFKLDLSVPLSSLRENFVFDSKATYSVPGAIIAFLESTDYESAVRNAVSLGGDADTEACIAGGIAEAFYKEIPEHIKKFCDSRIDISLKTPIREFNEKYNK